MVEAMEGIEEGVLIGGEGELLKDVRIADDQAMVASTEDVFAKVNGQLECKGKGVCHENPC